MINQELSFRIILNSLISFVARTKFFQGEAQAGGQKENWSGENEFLPAGSFRWWVGVRLPKARRASKQITPEMMKVVSGRGDWI